MTHRSASRCVFATHPTCWRPGNVACPQRSPGICSSAPRPTPHAPCSRLEIGFVFACSIPPLFVLSHSLPRVNTMDKLALFGRFSITASSLPSRLTDHYSLATRFTSHVPRPTIVGGRRRCRAPSWVQHSQPGRRQYATTCYFFGFSVEVWRAWFSTQLNIEIGLTSISL